MDANSRVFMDQDNDCHWYLVEASCRDKWNLWKELSSDDPASWEVPYYAIALGGGPSSVEFYNVEFV